MKEQLKFLRELQNLYIELSVLRGEKDVLKKMKREESDVVDEVVSRLEEKQQKIISRVEKNLFKRFERLHNRYREKVVARVINEVCEGCNMKVPTALITQIREARQIVFCEHCGRILYWGGSR